MSDIADSPSLTQSKQAAWKYRRRSFIRHNCALSDGLVLAVSFNEYLFVQATRLTLMCHARTVAQKLAQFPVDEPVEMDWHVARESRSHLFKKAFRLVCGPELRARQTAELFGSKMEIISALRDYNVGRWQGARIHDLQLSEPAALHAWLNDPELAPHGGESRLQLGQRIAAWLATLESTPGHIIAVTHPDVIRAALTQVLKSAAFNDIDVEPLAAIELRFNGRWRLRLSGADAEGI